MFERDDNDEFSKRQKVAIGFGIFFFFLFIPITGPCLFMYIIYKTITGGGDE